MTYCVGLRLNRGLVLMSDTRTNAGVDNISTYKKMTSWRVANDRVIVLMGAGNLATTQAVVSLLDERTKILDEREPSVLQQPTMFQLARHIGGLLRQVIENQSGKGGNQGPTMDSVYSATFIVAGQIGAAEPTMFMIYPEGNFIEIGQDTPFMQVGETKYGRPILLRAYEADMSFEEAIRLLLISFDSTIKANLSVDLPIDFCAIESGTYDLTIEGRFEKDDAYFGELSEGWGEALKQAVTQIPPLKLPSSTFSSAKQPAS
jgi:putative proteasome-type protease